MKNLLVLLLLFITFLNTTKGQNYYCSAFPNQDGEVELALLNNCGSEIQWQTRDTSSTEWIDIVNGTTNPFLLEASSQNIEGKEFRAQVILQPDVLPKYSYPFGIRLITSLEDLHVDDFYNGSFVYYSSEDTILGAYYTNENTAWGCFGVDIDGADGTAVGTGKQNTQDILASCTEIKTAAHICDELILNEFEDWYLPSFDELELILLTLKNNRIHQIQRQYGINFGEVNKSKFYWSSSVYNSINNLNLYAYYSLIYGGEINLGGNRKRDSELDILVSRNIISSDALSHTCNSILIPYQFLNHIDIVPVENNPSAASIEYLGNDQFGNQYNWDFDGGEVLSGTGAGPYVIQYKDALYKRVTMQFNNGTCSSPIFRADEFNVGFFEEHATDFPEIYGGSVRWADFNNDELLDVILSGSDTTAIYLSNEQGAFISLSQSFPGFSHSHVSIGDYDNDNLLDFLVCGSTIDSLPQTKLFKNIDGQSFLEIQTILPAIKYGFVEWIDYNNDGILDILISGQDINEEAMTRLYRGDKTGDFEQVQSSLPDLENGSISIDDYNKDNYPDLIIFGNIGNERITKIYRNNNGVFKENMTSLPGVFYGEADWADFDHDGRLDVVFSGNIDSTIVEIVGNSLSVTTSTSFYHYRNTGSENFVAEGTDSNDFGYPHKFGLSSVDCGDYNNDGYDDILISGLPNVNWVSVGVGGAIPVFYRKSMPSILENNTIGSFSTNNVDIPSFWTGDPLPVPTPPKRFECSSIRFGDFNRDGKLDILREGKHEGFASAIYENKTNTTNIPPLTPINLKSTITCDSIFLSWESSSDDHTPESSITYEIYLGTSPSSGDVFSKKNVRNLRNTYFKLDSLPDDIYYWSVKAIDNAMANSEYAQEQFFEIDCITSIQEHIVPSYKVLIYPNPFSEDFSISVEGIDHQIHYLILDQHGQIVLDGFFKNSIKIVNEAWESGVYYLNLGIDDEIFAKKIIHVK